MQRFKRWQMGEEEYLKMQNQVEEKNNFLDGEDDEVQDNVKAEDAKR